MRWLTASLVSLLLVFLPLEASADKAFPLPDKHSVIAQEAAVLSADIIDGACGAGNEAIFVRLEYKGVRYNYFYGSNSQIGLFVELAVSKDNPEVLNPVYVWVFSGADDLIKITRAVEFSKLFPAEQESACGVVYPATA